MEDYVEMTQDEIDYQMKRIAEINSTPSAAEIEMQRSGFDNGKNIRVTIECYSTTLDIMKVELGTSTHQQTFNKLISLYTDLPEECLVQKDYGKRRSRENNEIERSKTMGRKKLAANERKKSYSVSLTETEMAMVQGKFSTLTKGVLFLNSLMIRLYEEGVIPDHVIEEEMKKHE